MEVYMIVVRAGSVIDRADLEKIEGMTFKSIEDAKKEMLNINPSGEESEMQFAPLFRFTTAWNNTDMRWNYVENDFGLHETYISYVFINN